MSRMDLPRWSLALALLLVPAALHAQDTTKHGGKDSAATIPALKPPAAAKTVVICRDGTSGADSQSCASHGGVDEVTTNASRTGRVDPHGVETGQAGMGGDSGIRIKTDTTQPPGWGMPPDIKADSARSSGDSTS